MKLTLSRRLMARRPTYTMKLSARLVEHRQLFMATCELVRKAEKKWVETQNEATDTAWEICNEVLESLRAKGFFGNDPDWAFAYISESKIVAYGHDFQTEKKMWATIQGEDHYVVIECELDLLDLEVNNAAEIIVQRMLAAPMNKVGRPDPRP